MLSNEAIRQQVETLLSQMTLEEKAAQMVQVPYTVVGREEALRWAKLGAGSFLHVLGDDAREVQQAALHSRLGIPVLFGIDAIHGHGLNDHATIFPSLLARTIRRPSAEKVALRTSLPKAGRVDRSRPDAVSQMFAVWSRWAVAMRVPSGEN